MSFTQKHNAAAKTVQMCIPCHTSGPELAELLAYLQHEDDERRKPTFATLRWVQNKGRKEESFAAMQQNG
eukprot:402120-Pelagomonas_calceolata.AAC.3